MDEQMISVIDAAAELGTKKGVVFKVMKRLGITALKQRNPESGNQLVSYITQSELDRIKDEYRGNRLANDSQQADDGFISAEIGVFYLLQLEPEHDPTRLKVGFAANIGERLRALKCSAPFTTVLKTWPCKRLWEKTAIDCVTVGCEQLHTEVFRSNSIDRVSAKCDAFFAMMPDVASIAADDVDAKETDETEVD